MPLFYPLLFKSFDLAAYLFVYFTMISRISFISVTFWNILKGVEPWSRSTSTSASVVHSFFVVGFSLFCYFHSSIVLFFSTLFCLPHTFFWFVLFSLDVALTFFFFILSLIIELCFRFLVFLGSATVGEADLSDWSEVRLVTTAVGDWLAVRWVAVAGDWLAVRWLAGEGD